MKHARYAIVLLGLLTAALVASGFGQLSIPLKANIPFDFQVGNKMFPAGEYRLEPMNSTLLIRSTDKSANAAMILVGSCRTLKAQERSKLIFHRYGSNYFLSKVWVAGETAGADVPTSSREKEIANSGAATEVALLIR
jgi:hypothetical protein